MGGIALRLLVTGSANSPPRKHFAIVNKRRAAPRVEVTITLTDANGGTSVLAVHGGLPCGLPTANKPAWRSTLATLAAFFATGQNARRMSLLRLLMAAFWQGEGQQRVPQQPVALLKSSR